MGAIENFQERLESISWDRYLIGVTLFHLLVTFLLSCLLIWLTGFFWFGLIAGVLVWSGILLKTSLVEMFYVEIEKFHGVVFINQLIHDKAPESPEEKTKLFPASSLREKGQGIHGKLPWEDLTVIDMRRHIGIDETFKVYSEEGLELTIEWYMILTPLRTSLPNTVRHGDEAIKNYFTASAQEWLLAKARTLKEAEIFGTIAASGEKGEQLMKSGFKEMFGGPNKIIDVEEQWGVFTNEPTIKGIKRSEQRAKSAEGEKIAEDLDKIGQKLKEQFPNADHDIAMLTALAVIGKVTPDIVIIPGLKGIDSASIAALANLRRGRGGK